MKCLSQLNVYYNTGEHMNLTQEEMAFIFQTISQVQFKTGQSNMLLLAESIVNKLKAEIEKQLPEQQEG